MVEDIVFGTSSHLEILRFLQHTIGSRKGPQDASVEDGSLLGIGMQLLLGIDSPIEAAILAVHHLILPKAQDVVHDNILHFVS